MIDEFDKIAEQMMDMNICTDDEIFLVGSINGFTIESLNDILYVKTGYHDMEQLMEECV